MSPFFSSQGTLLFQKGKQKRHAPADEPWWSYLPDALLFYAKGLHKGHRCLFQALPRLLTLWFEFGTHFRGDALSTKHVKTVFGRVRSHIDLCIPLLFNISENFGVKVETVFSLSALLVSCIGQFCLVLLCLLVHFVDLIRPEHLIHFLLVVRQ